MRTEISSRETRWYRFVGPTFFYFVWILGVLQLMAGVRVPGIPRTNAVLVWILLGIIGTIWFGRSPRLMRMQMTDGHLYASDFRREIEILPGDIASVTQNSWDRVRPITIHLRAPSPFGSRIRFLPPSRVSLRFWIEDSIVSELREFARTGIFSTSNS